MMTFEPPISAETRGEKKVAVMWETIRLRSDSLLERVVGADGASRNGFEAGFVEFRWGEAKGGGGAEEVIGVCEREEASKDVARVSSNGLLAMNMSCRRLCTKGSHRWRRHTPSGVLHLKRHHFREGTEFEFVFEFGAKCGAVYFYESVKYSAAAVASYKARNATVC
ncbi:hypothetical protein VNO78_12512 [Psophocarpus tetragonolobus]|uniref:Uncharacterized protein n=1 Tax=Psophocarpus tetragonolobus TaxID=3891 RepID=A0AAN9SP42_PSOTE